mgnify:CR=1 FL=1
MDTKKLNLPLPVSTHEAVFREARRRRVPATRLVRSILDDWLAEQARERRAEEIRRFATANGGSAADLDPELESAGLQLLEEGHDGAQG